MRRLACSSRKLAVTPAVSDTDLVDAITSTKMLQLAQVMQQLPAEHGLVDLPQLEHARDALQSIEAIPAQSAPEPLLVSPPQHVDLRA